MTDHIRRLVSGKKARYTEDGFDLDLVKLTDRIFVMGYPADGLAGWYRNKRSDVLRFLEPYAPHYRIFNLCPLYENAYDAGAFTHEGVQREGKAVERFPWPDHHPPPLPLMRIMSSEAKAWYEADERNIVVIHCKAGKGRSGSFAISLLLTLPGLPSAPAMAVPADEEKAVKLGESKYSLDARAVQGKSENEIAGMTYKEKLEYLLRFHTMRRMSPGAKSYGVSIASQRRFLGYFSRVLSGDDPRPPVSSGDPSSKPRRALLEYVKILGPGLHGASKILSGGKDKMAVQVFRYKDSIAANLRRRELALTCSISTASSDDLEDWDDRDEMFVHVGGLSEVPTQSSAPSPSAAPSPTPSPVPAVNPVPVATSSSHLPVAETASVASVSTGSLPSAVLATPTSAASSSPSLPPPSGTSALADSTASAPSSRTPRTHTLVPLTSYLPPVVVPLEATNPSRRSETEARKAATEDGGIVLDGDREVQLRVLVGEKGKKHGMLPAMAALAIAWFIPSFGSVPATTGADSHLRSRLLLGAKELDFLKPFAGIEEVEIGWRWLQG
ncbi:hypothetical protein JCM10213_000173 [Rhodosporidiobolus nylandii]